MADRCIRHPLVKIQRCGTCSKLHTHLTAEQPSSPFQRMVRLPRAVLGMSRPDKGAQYLGGGPTGATPRTDRSVHARVAVFDTKCQCVREALKTPVR
jgi:hypothetical protein